MPDTETTGTALVPLQQAIRVGNGHAFVSHTALYLSDAATEEEWASLRPQLHMADSGVEWWWGDWYLEGEARFEGFAQYLPEVKFARHTLQNRASVCKRFPSNAQADSPIRRRAALTFTHHADVAGIKADDVVGRLLDLAELNEWTSAELREKVRELTERVQEHEASEGGQAGSDGFLPLDLPVSWGQLASVAEEHLDREDQHSLWVALGGMIADGVEVEDEDTVTLTPKGEAALDAEPIDAEFTDDYSQDEETITPALNAPPSEEDEFLSFATNYVPA